MKRIIIGIILFLIAGISYGADAVGAGVFLRMGAGARAGALSGAFTAHYDDATVSYWNPAAAARLEKISVSSMFAFLAADFKYSFFNAVFPTEYGNFGANIINLSSGEIEGRSSETDDYFTFEHSETAVFGTYGRKLSEWVSVGANIKILNVNSFNEGAGGFGFDLGFLIIPHEMLSAGLVMQDLYSEISWTTGTKQKVPYVMRLGAMAKLLDDALRVSLDAEKVEFEEVSIKTGAEYGFFDIVFVRAGASYGFSDYDFNYTLGAGFRYAIGNVTLQLDYAFYTYEFSGPQTAVDTNHKLSVAAYF